MSAKVSIKTSALAVVGLCSLLGACTEQRESTRSLKQTPPAEAAAQPAPAKQTHERPSEAPPLTATAPMAPHSILDGRAMPEGKGVAVEEASRSAEPEQRVGLHGAEQLSPSPEQIKVDRFVLATGVEKREPVGETDSFTTETPQIFAFMQFQNDQAPFAVKVHWEKVGEEASPYGVQLEVPMSPRYRTWSWTKIRREPGTYRAVVRTLDGQEVVSKEFTISASTSE